MTGPLVRVALADDHHLFRDGLASLLAQSPRVTVVGQASSSVAAVRMAEERAPDVLLLDVEMDDVPAAVTIRRLGRLAPATRVVVLTMHGDPVLERQLRSEGAADYLTKDVSAPHLVDRIASVARLGGRGAAPLPSADAEPPSAGILTDRELQVLRMIGQAQTNRAIASALSIAEGTVKRHVVHIFAKLGASSRIDAIRKAHLLGEV